VTPRPMVRSDRSRVWAVGGGAEPPSSLPTKRERQLWSCGRASRRRVGSPGRVVVGVRVVHLCNRAEHRAVIDVRNCVVTTRCVVASHTMPVASPLVPMVYLKDQHPRPRGLLDTGADIRRPVELHVFDHPRAQEPWQIEGRCIRHGACIPNLFAGQMRRPTLSQWQDSGCISRVLTLEGPRRTLSRRVAGMGQTSVPLSVQVLETVRSHSPSPPGDCEPRSPQHRSHRRPSQNELPMGNVVVAMVPLLFQVLETVRSHSLSPPGDCEPRRPQPTITPASVTERTTHG
jgi:hypothetical protein